MSVCMFGHKKIYKVTNLKVHSKGRYFVKKKKRTTIKNKWLVWTTKLFSCICNITKINPTYGNSNCWRVGEHLIEHYNFQNRNPVRVFLYHCISDGNRLFSENVGCRFHFILHVIKGWGTLILEGHSPAEFSSIPEKTGKKIPNWIWKDLD